MFFPEFSRISLYVLFGVTEITMPVFVTAANRGKNLLKTLNSQLVFCAPECAKTHVRQSWHPKEILMYLAAFDGSAVSVPSKKYLPLQHWCCLFYMSRKPDECCQLSLWASQSVLPCSPLSWQLLYIAHRCDKYNQFRSTNQWTKNVKMLESVKTN